MINKELAKKKDLFFYFALRLKMHYEILEKYHELQHVDLSVHRILLMLYIATVKDNRMLDVGFNNFFAVPKGPVEIDCYFFAKEFGLAKIIKDDNLIRACCDEISIKEEEAKIINSAVWHLHLGICERDDDGLRNLACASKSYRIAWLRANVYQRHSFFIFPEDIKRWTEQRKEII